jgi:integrase
MLNVEVDRRHDRRALSADEFARLVEAAASGPTVVCISGADRAITYVLSAWTAYRKAEIGSLTKRSLRLDDSPPTVTACYSKRKRQDTQVLHPEVANRLREWLKTKKESDVLEYQDDEGLFADFHSNRHTFITNRERAGVSPQTAQTLARHCDSRRRKRCPQWCREVPKMVPFTLHR